jgi:myo-inositol-1(or 4)-monophosphatase
MLAARAGADAIRSVVRAGPLDTRFKSASHDMVTAADKASELAIFSVLRTARPDDTIVGEEGGSHIGPSPVRWLVDPLDGTANFVYGRSDFAVSVGATLDGVPIAGAIVRPTDGQWIMTGDKGVYAGRESDPAGVTISAARNVPLSDALITVGLPYSLAERRRVLTIVANLALVVRGIRVVGSAAGDLAALTLGQCDGFVGFGLAQWDTAAGQALLIRAGGAVREIGSPRAILIAGGSEQFVDILAQRIGRMSDDRTAANSNTIVTEPA